jgi:hypothetical protein
MSEEAPAANSTNTKVTADSYGSVQVEEVSNECWLVRVPPNLADHWEKAAEGSVLGELVFTKGGKVNNVLVKPQVDIVVPPADDPALPLEYQLQAMTKKIPNMHPISRHANGSVTLQGTITRTANCQVKQIHDVNYRKLCKERLLNTTVNSNRYVKPVESNQVVSQSNKNKTPSKGFGNAVHLYGKRLLEQANQPTLTKKTKFDPDQPTKSVIFALFSQQQYWTVKDLKLASGGRPETEIRDTLRELGDYHRSGDNKNSWELRKEFQNQK